MALNSASWTGQRIVTVVARFYGVANDSNSRAAVLDNINLGLWEMSLNTPWDWNAITAANISVSASTATYSLVTAAGSEHDEIYDVRLVGAAERTLDPIDQRTYDRYVRGEQGATSTPTHYFVYGAQQGAVITLVPTPAAADTLSIRYIRRQQVISDASASSLEIPDKFVPLVIYRGAHLTGLWKNDESKAGHFAVLYERALRRALNVNAVKPDEVPTMVPRIESQATRLDYVNPSDQFYDS